MTRLILPLIALSALALACERPARPDAASPLPPPPAVAPPAAPAVAPAPAGSVPEVAERVVKSVVNIARK